MDHLEAANLGATEKYLLGTLDEAQRDAFEEHFFDCLDCAEDIRAAAAVLAVAGASTPASLAEAAPAAVIPIRRRSPRMATFVATVSSLAAAICLSLYQGFVVIPNLEREVASVDTLQAVPSHFLTLTRSEAPVVRVGAGDRQVALTLSRSWDKPFPSYRCELRDASDRVVLAETLRSPSPADELEVLLPVKGLAAGSYVLVVEGVQGDQPGDGPPPGSGPVARYAFKLERQAK
jgi:Putative zinc-finger